MKKVCLFSLIFLLICGFLLGATGCSQTPDDNYYYIPGQDILSIKFEDDEWGESLDNHKTYSDPIFLQETVQYFDAFLSQGT